MSSFFMFVLESLREWVSRYNMIDGNCIILLSIRDTEIVPPLSVMQLFVLLLHSSLLIHTPESGVRGHIRVCIVLQSGEGSSYRCEISSISAAFAVWIYCMRMHAARRANSPASCLSGLQIGSFPFPACSFFMSSSTENVGLSCHETIFSMKY